MQYVYGAIFLLSLVLIPLYLAFIHKRQSEPRLLALFICASTVNLGYMMISFSNTVEFALFANKIAYLGQVAIPLCMFMIISKLCGYTYKKWLYGILIGAAALLFALVCTTGHLDWYYSDAWIESIDGATILRKEYGPLHPANLIYVILYFIGMISVIGMSLSSRKSASQKHACGMLIIVLGNIVMWCVGKIIPWEIEFLSVTYLMSMWAFLIEWMTLQDYVHKKDLAQHISKEKQTIVVVDSLSRADKLKTLLSLLPSDKSLTAREIDILGELVEGKTRKDIAALHHITENTVKTHVTHIYEKFGVASKDALLALVHKN